MPIHSPFLKYFREVARCGSVRLAARRLYVSSSAVNRQILKIEAELGVQLFDRKPHGMTLTEAGRCLAQHVERTLDDEARCLQALKALHRSEPESLTLCGQESVIADLLPPVLMAWHARFPQVSTVFKAAGGDALRAMLQDGQADVVIGFDVEANEFVEIIATQELPVGAIVAPRHPLAQRGAVSLSDCVDFPMILPDESWPLRALLDRELAKLEQPPRVVTTSNSVEFLRRMIDEQLGVGFQTVVGIENSLRRQELVHVPLSAETPLLQQLSLCISAETAPRDAMAAFIDLFRERLQPYAEEWC